MKTKPNPIAAIARFLAAPSPLTAGAVLLRTHGTPEKWAIYMRTQNNKKALVLRRLLASTISDIEAKTPKRIAVKTQLSIADKFKAQYNIPFNELPETLKLLVFKRHQLWTEAKAAYNNMSKADTDAQRFDLVKEAVTKYIQNRAIWDELNYYAKFRFVRTDCKVLKKTRLEKELETLRDLPPVQMGMSIEKKITSLRQQIRRNTIQKKSIQNLIQRLAALQQLIDNH